MKPDRNAAVAVIHAGEVDMRPALFVFLTPDGFAWIEPAYREPNPSRPALHAVRGSLQMGPMGFSCDGEDGRYYIVGALADLETGTGDDLRRACEWAEADIEAAGTTMDAERERLRQVLADPDTEL